MPWDIVAIGVVGLVLAGWMECLGIRALRRQGRGETTSSDDDLAAALAVTLMPTALLCFGGVLATGIYYAATGGP